MDVVFNVERARAAVRGAEHRLGDGVHLRAAFSSAANRARELRSNTLAPHLGAAAALIPCIATPLEIKMNFPLSQLLPLAGPTAHRRQHAASEARATITAAAGTLFSLLVLACGRTHCSLLHYARHPRQMSYHLCPSAIFPHFPKP